MSLNPASPIYGAHPKQAPEYDSDDILANAPVGIYTSTPDGHFLAVNAAMARMFGYASPEEMIASVGNIPAELYLKPEDREDFLRTVSAQGQVTDHEMRMKRRDGSTMWVCSNARTLRGEQGVLFQGFMTDITRRKEAEEALVFSEHRHRIIFENSPLGMAFFESDGTIVDCNDALLGIMKSSRERLIGFNAKLLESPIAKSGLQRALAGNPVFIEGEYTSVTGNRTRMLRANFKPQRPGHSPTAVIATIEDITEQVRMAQAMRESEALQRNLLDILPTGVTLIDEQTRIIERANDQMGTLYGGTAEDLIGRTCKDVLCVADRNGCPCGTDVERVDNMHCEMRRRDGSRLTILKTVKRIDFKGRKKLLECVVDMSERRRVEEKLHAFAQQMELKNLELDNARLKAERAARDKGAFLSRMSHEIRTPLNGVIGMTGLLLETPLDETQRRYAQTLRSSGESLMEVVNDILDLSRIESGRFELENVDFDLRALLDDIASMLAVNAADKKLELVCSADPDVPERFTGEPGFLRQIITNLAGNALKFTPRGEVEIRVSLAGGVAQEDDSGPSGGRRVSLLFTVRDTGIGIAPDRQERIFQDFSQADASISRRFGGSGLGLTISKRLVEIMAGEIGVQSVLGSGSTFWFTAPLKTAAPLTNETYEPQGLRGLRTLIVDDNTTNREILLARFAAWGMLPEEAEGGPSALAMLKRAASAGTPYRLVLVDASMPGMDGEALGKAIISEPSFRGTRMVLMTSLGQHRDDERYRRAGFSASLCKPLAHGELLACLNATMDARTRPPSETRRPAIQRKRADIPDFSGRNCRVLLVEDNVTNQQVALGILSNFGLEVDISENGAEAVELLSHASYDLVLMDVQMPVMDGCECTSIIRNPLSAVLDHNVPVLAMTAHAQVSDRKRCIDAGMNDYVAKPISVKELAAALSTWLPAESGQPRNRGPRPMPRGREDLTVIWDKPAFMNRIMDDEELARDIVGGFRTDTLKRADVIRQAVADGDLAVAATQAHSIKGAAANLGAENLREAAQNMESVAKDGRITACDAALANLQGALRTLVEEFERLGSLP